MIFPIRNRWVFALCCVLGCAGAVLAADPDDSPSWPSTKPKPAAKPSTPKPAAKPPQAPADETPKAPETEAERIKREAREVFGIGAGPVKSVDGAVGPQGWVVVLGVFRGEERESASAVMLRRVRTEGGLPEAYAVHRNEAVVVALGDFESADDPKAEEALHRIQQMEFGGQRPYARAFLSPPMKGEIPGTMPKYNLLHVKEVYGENVLYTLQVAVYGRLDLKTATENDLAESRKAAERAAYQLRQEGEIAFYYHAPTMSMVTVGVFDIHDFDPQTPSFKSEALRAAQKKFPYNLYNGQGIKEKRNAGGGKVVEQMQASNLVAIPGK